MNSTPDPALLAAHDLALAALHEITPVATVGSAAGYTVEADGVVSLRFETTLRGYPGWFWTVSVARVGEDQPTVLEVELLPGEEALLAPEWVPWAVRLADYQAAQAALAAEAASGDEDDDSDAGVDDASDAGDEDDDLDDVDDLDVDDFDEDGSRLLHSGDVDGVDIDELDDDANDDDDTDADDDDTDDDDTDAEDLDGEEDADDAEDVDDESDDPESNDPVED
ncbi:DUF3027 domain-containing protein [Microbacterium schleiferi]|uniref:DUF3027 domain-containing protein n=1 Tax=Microbacterium schleiferi TaxID=69362 RepID=A0A7S8MWR6_9MICO|nr:DUF3027 domain-containing protein [Microbacterium schleiferi]QPE03925.1 DUF3027 domain-containing protein [Microbacterium schleiferi]